MINISSKFPISHWTSCEIGQTYCWLEGSDYRLGILSKLFKAYSLNISLNIVVSVCCTAIESSLDQRSFFVSDWFAWSSFWFVVMSSVCRISLEVTLRQYSIIGYRLHRSSDLWFHLSVSVSIGWFTFERSIWSQF